MRRILVALVASLLGIALTTPAQAATTYTPAFTAGPRGGDSHTFVDVDSASGTITIFQHNTRQAAAVHCIGDGPRGTFRLAHGVSEPVSTVAVSYAHANMSEHPIIDVLVTGSESGWLGHGVSHGPKDDESGTVNVPLQATPVGGEALTITFGLQVHAGCLPHPTLLGLFGSRLVEGGRVTFTSVQVG